MTSFLINFELGIGAVKIFVDKPKPINTIVLILEPTHYNNIEIVQIYWIFIRRTVFSTCLKKHGFLPPSLMSLKTFLKFLITIIND